MTATLSETFTIDSTLVIKHQDVYYTFTTISLLILLQMTDTQPAEELETLLQLFVPIPFAREQDIPVPTVHRAICAAEKSIQSFQDDIGRLKAKQASIGLYLRACISSSAPSPIRFLPNEILLQIFAIYAVDGIRLTDAMYKTGKCRFLALRLGRVCSHWRKLLLAVLPSLASNIHFRLYDGPEDFEKEEYSTFDRFFQLSSPTKTPMTVYIDTHALGSEDFKMPFPCSLPSLDRISCLSLRFTIAWIFRHPSCSYQSLHTLDLGYDHHSTIGLGLDLTQSAPNLRSLKMQDDAKIQVLWDRLHTLILDCCTPPYIALVLNKCHNLSYLGFEGCCCFNDHRDFSADIMTHPHVTLLSHKECNEEFLDCILPVLNLPSLIQCNITKSYEPIANTFNALCWPAIPSLRRLEFRLQVPLSSSHETEFISMVKSRWQAKEGRKLESVQLQVGVGSNDFYWFKDKLWEPLQQMQKEGLRVHVDDSFGCVRTRVESKAVQPC